MKIKLFVSHRIDQENKVIKNEIITPVYCGAIYKNDEWQEGLIGDDTGDNISEKRMSYCELTVQYWAWKNIEADYYGLCHYRRYLSFGSTKGWRNEQNQIHLPILNKECITKYKFDDISTIGGLCKKYDAILSEPANVLAITPMGKKPTTVKELWETHEEIFFGIGMLEILLDAIQEIRPEYYSVAIEYFKSDKHRGYNCFLMSKKIFCNLCDFQFSIMKKLEEKIPNNMLKKYPRTIGYMGEILFGVYQYFIIKSGYKIKFVPLVFFENTSLKTDKLTLMKLEGFYYTKRFAVEYLPKPILKILKTVYHIIK